MAPIKPSSLKVVELRQELSSRGLPTKGRKDELVARLTEALTTEDKEPVEEQPVADSQPSTEAAAAQQDATLQATEAAATQQDTTLQATEKPTEPTPVDKPVIETPTETISTHQPSETPEKKSPESFKDQSMQDETVKDQQLEEPAKADYDQALQETNESPVTDKSVSPEDVPMESSTNKSVVNQNDQTQDDSTNPTEASNKADTTLKRKGEPLNEEKQEKKTKLDESNDGIKSSALYVKGFVRPLIIRQVQDLFGKYGNVKRFWMDNIKTHCYVVYETDTQASEAFNKVNGITFPADTGKALSVGDLTSEQAEQLISFEQSAAERRIRVEWEANIDKVKAGEELASPLDGRKTRNIGIGQIAKQLAQAAAPGPAVTASRTPTPTTEKAQEQNDSNLALEDLFRKTQALPALYYLPISEEIAQERLAKLSR